MSVQSAGWGSSLHCPHFCLPKIEIVACLTGIAPVREQGIPPREMLEQELGLTVTQIQPSSSQPKIQTGTEAPHQLSGILSKGLKGGVGCTLQNHTAEFLRVAQASLLRKRDMRQPQRLGWGLGEGSKIPEPPSCHCSPQPTLESYFGERCHDTGAEEFAVSRRAPSAPWSHWDGSFGLCSLAVTAALRKALAGVTNSSVH